jgi:hypothetical protein
MTEENEELIKAVNELKLEIQRIREVVNMLLNVVIEGEMEEDPRGDAQLGFLKDFEHFSGYN